MTRTATRSAWGTWIGFESCPTLLGRLVEGFAGPWTPLQDVPVPDPATAPVGDADASPDAARETAGAIGCVVLAARSPADLRRAVPLRGLLPIATRVRIALADAPSWAAQPLPVAAPGACWRHLTEMRIVRRGRGWHLDAAFTEPVPAGDVVAHVANGLFGGCAATTPVAGIEGGGTADWRPGDPNVTLSPPGGPHAGPPRRPPAATCHCGEWRWTARVRTACCRRSTRPWSTPSDSASIPRRGWRRSPRTGTGSSSPSAATGSYGSRLAGGSRTWTSPGCGTCAGSRCPRSTHRQSGAGE
ncbi:hypothetical protein [Microbispora sp. GKU 823]|uniref:hypothetical protein n=1 Tax=Microbispora sp. GKU 823 TaxID=1652100 RepID=UPI0009A3F3DB|nr:hypothetical protein [Microbispora sp. GKU 823]OPG10886.1 hypothetical protein B1L11_22155 [Microbispora sp. GKU 823]